MSKSVYFLSIIISLSITSCKQSAPKTFVQKVEEAHQKQNFLSHDAVSFNLILRFGGTERLNGKLTLSTNSSKGLIEMIDGKKIYYIDDKVYHSPNIKNSKGARFSAYTWSYFFLFPYKLSDEGTVWNDYPNKELNNKTYEVEKVSFKPGTGDAPDDWYIAYANPTTYQLEVVPYIVTAGQTKKEAEEYPHAIEYQNYKQTSGVPFATKWVFWEWNEKEGLTKQLGDADLTDITFQQITPQTFNVPDTFVLVE